MAGFDQIGSRDPAAFFSGVRDQLKPLTIVLIGDSQGMVVKGGAGLPYPQLVARALAKQAGGTSVVSLHLGGANTFEQGTLLLGMLEAGVVPRAVFWSHSVFSLRKNEIRAELVPLYKSLPDEDTGRPAVILIGGASEPAGAAGPLSQRILQAASQRLDEWLSVSATMRFSRRELWEKSTILWASPLGRLVPAALRPRTGEQRDPSASILESSARFAGQVTGVLHGRGVRVIHFLAPIGRAANPRPFSARAEATAYPALERAVEARGGEFVSWIDLLPGTCYGKYEDGSDDALHIKTAGQERLARRIVETTGRGPERALEVLARSAGGGPRSSDHFERRRPLDRPGRPRPLVEPRQRASAQLAHVERQVVHVHVDEPPALPGVEAAPELQGVRDGLVLVVERGLDGGAEADAHRAHQVRAQVAAHHVEPERHGQPVALLPQLAEVEDLHEPLLAVGQLALVDDHAGLDLARERPRRGCGRTSPRPARNPGTRSAAAAPPW